MIEGKTVSNDNISRILMATWLDHFKKRRFVGKIHTYRIDAIDVDVEGKDCFLFSATYAVQADRDTVWKNLPHAEMNGWIRLSGQFQVNSVAQNYRLTLLDAAELAQLPQLCQAAQ